MKIGIFTFVPPWEKARPADVLLKKTAQYLGHTARIVRSFYTQIVFDDQKRSLLYKGKPFPRYDVMIMRATVLHNVDLEISPIKQIQLMGIPVVNEYLPILRAKNKLRTLQMLRHADIPVPRTAAIHTREHIDETLATIGVTYPLILKTPFGSLGAGVAIVESKRALHSALDLLWKDEHTREMLLVQEYVKEAKGKDIRVVVVGKKIVAAMERRARRGEFRSNFDLGGTVRVTDLTEREQEYALRARETLQLDVAGVDILRTNEGPKVIEVNANPGLEGITQASGENIAEPIIKFALRKAQRAARKNNGKKS